MNPLAHTCVLRQKKKFTGTEEVHPKGGDSRPTASQASANHRQELFWPQLRTSLRISEVVMHVPRTMINHILRQRLEKLPHELENLQTLNSSQKRKQSELSKDYRSQREWFLEHLSIVIFSKEGIFRVNRRINHQNMITWGLNIHWSKMKSLRAAQRLCFVVLSQKIAL